MFEDKDRTRDVTHVMCFWGLPRKKKEKWEGSITHHLQWAISAVTGESMKIWDPRSLSWELLHFWLSLNHLLNVTKKEVKNGKDYWKLYGDHFSWPRNVSNKTNVQNISNLEKYTTISFFLCVVIQLQGAV